jgi:hypothetical protein
MANLDTPPNAGIVPITDLDSFVRALVHWHTNKVAMLRHLAEIPEGTEMSVGDEAPIVLEGDILAGFKAGLETALIELGELPFSFTLEDEAAADQAQIDTLVSTGVHSNLN